MTRTTIRVSVWPGRLPVAGNFRFHGAGKRAAGVHGGLSRLGRDCTSRIVGQGCRAGASNAGWRKLASRTCRLFLFLVGAFWLMTVASAHAVQEDNTSDAAVPATAVEQQKQGQAKGKIPEPLITDPQPPCQFNPDQGPEMVLIEGGRFLMGSGGDEAGRYGDEGPQHWVSVQPFALGRCEVTVREFQQFVKETGYRTEAEEGKGCNTLNAKGESFETQKDKSWSSPGFSQNENHPVSCISFNDAQAYIAWLNLRTGVTFRLPSESEWEYAARAGTTTRFSFGDDPQAREQCTYANGADISVKDKPFAKERTLADCNDHYEFTAPVGSFKPNVFGLYDMHGNVWEWNQDCWHDSYSGAPPDGSAWLAPGKGDCEKAVVRGGSWFSYPRSLRSAYRVGLSSGVAFYVQGFRLARTL